MSSILLHAVPTPAEGRSLLAPLGAPRRAPEGAGCRCGQCHAVVLEDVSPAWLAGAAVRCPACGTWGELPTGAA